MVFDKASIAAHVGPIAALLTLVAPAAAQSPRPVLAYPAIETSAMMRNVNTPSPTTWRPDDAEQQVPLDLLIRYRDALATGQDADAIALGHEEFRASLARARPAAATMDSDWARGQIALTRMTWYPAPAGQPHNLYVAFDLLSSLDDGRFACGYLIVSRIAASGSDYRVVSQAITYVEPSLVEDRMPRADVTAELQCWLGENVRTGLNP